MDDTIITAIIITGGVGLLAAVMLVVASKLMHVKVDEKVGLLRDALPGANCGACGFSGCDGYAAALARGECAPDLCPPGGTEVFNKLGEILGSGDGDAPVSKKAIVRCAGREEAKTDKINYAGIDTCLASEQLHGGQNACSFGCLGFGDCAKVCPGDAICITGGAAYIDAGKCTGCGLCVKACPRDVIELLTEPVKTAVLCRNTEKGAVVRKKCTAGCIACTKCVRECPLEAIRIEDNLAIIDSDKCDGCGRCAEVCMTKCIYNALYIYNAPGTESHV